MLIASDLRLALDPVAFARAAGIDPDPWQADMLSVPPRRGLICNSRQSGKTTVTALLVVPSLHFAPKSVAPALHSVLLTCGFSIRYRSCKRPI